MDSQSHDTQGPGRGVSAQERVLVVDADARWRGDVVAALQRGGCGAAAEQQAGLLLALGDIGGRGAPRAVVGRAAALEGEVAPFASALRRVAPQARLIVTALPEEEPEARAAVRAGFDDYLIEPVEARELAQAVYGAAPRPAAPAMASKAVVETPSIAPAVPAPSAPPGSGDSAELGDVDLVEHLLGHRAGVVDVALRLATMQSGMAGLGFVERESDLPRGHHQAAVEHAGQTLGLLHAPAPATPAALAPWGRWLASWLALEGRCAGLWEMAWHDELTGAWNRRYFQRFLEAILRRARDQRFRVTLLVFDIDDFKVYNDRYGHAAGDEILRETARLMQSVVRKHDVVARIGGDEFGVIFWDAGDRDTPPKEHPQDVFKAAQRFQKAIFSHNFPKLADQAPGTLTISGGLAGFPWDGQTPQELVERADQMALQSKRQGKNAITFGPGTLRETTGEGT